MILNDSYHILTPMASADANANTGFMHEGDEDVPAKANLRHVVNGFSYVKYLRAYENGEAISRKIADSRCSINIGVDNWKRILDWNALAEDHIGKHRCHFWKLSDDGHAILKMADANDAYYRVMRWYDGSLNDDDRVTEIVKAELRGEEAWKANDPIGFIEMLDSLLNPESLCRKAGSSYRWMNKIMFAAKKYDSFRKHITSHEVLNWLEEHKDFDGALNLKRQLEKIAKKMASIS